MRDRLPIPDDMIRPADVGKTGYCALGMRAWFARHRLNHRRFLRDGISVQQFVEAGDFKAIRIVLATCQRRLRQAEARLHEQVQAEN